MEKLIIRYSMDDNVNINSVFW